MFHLCNLNNNAKYVSLAFDFEINYVPEQTNQIYNNIILIEYKYGVHCAVIIT